MRLEVGDQHSLESVRQFPPPSDLSAKANGHLHPFIPALLPLNPSLPPILTPLLAMRRLLCLLLALCLAPTAPAAAAPGVGSASHVARALRHPATAAAAPAPAALPASLPGPSPPAAASGGNLSYLAGRVLAPVGMPHLPALWRTRAVAVTPLEERLHYEIPSSRRTQLSRATIPPGCEGEGLPTSLGYGYCPFCDTGSSGLRPYWKAGGWTRCSALCGGGVRTRELACYSGVDDSLIDRSLCNQLCGLGLGDGVCNVQPCVEIDQTEFSCDPRNPYYQPLRCSDLSRDGGRLTVQVLALTNAHRVADCSAAASPLAQCGPRYRDPAFAGLPDPYVKVRVEGMEAATPAFYSTRSAVWGDGRSSGANFFLGVRASGTPITFEVWDRNGGLTLGDRLVASVSTTVIACSWASSTKYAEGCTERTYLPLLPNASCLLNANASTPDPRAPCLRIRQIVVPHNLTVGRRRSASPRDELAANPRLADDWNASFSMANTWSFANSVGDVSDAESRSSDTFTAALDAGWPGFARAVGGLLLRFAPPVLLGNGKYKGVSAAGRGESQSFTLNYRSRVFLFRWVATPAMFAATEPTWLKNGSSWQLLPDSGPGALTARLLNTSSLAAYAGAANWSAATRNSAGELCAPVNASAVAEAAGAAAAARAAAARGNTSTQATACAFASNPALASPGLCATAWCAAGLDTGESFVPPCAGSWCSGGWGGDPQRKAASWAANRSAEVLAVGSGGGAWGGPVNASLPLPTAFFWSAGPWSPCSETCGSGISVRNLSCWAVCNVTGGRSCTPLAPPNGTVTVPSLLFPNSTLVYWDTGNASACLAAGCATSYGRFGVPGAPPLPLLPTSQLLQQRSVCSNAAAVAYNYRAYAWTGADPADHTSPLPALQGMAAAAAGAAAAGSALDSASARTPGRYPALLASGSAALPPSQQPAYCLSSSSCPAPVNTAQLGGAASRAADAHTPSGLMAAGTTFSLYGAVDGWDPALVAPDYFNGTNARPFFLVALLDPDVTPAVPAVPPPLSLPLLLASCLLLLLPQLLLLACQWPLLQAIAFRPDVLQSYLLSRGLPESGVAARAALARARAKAAAVAAEAKAAAAAEAAARRAAAKAAKEAAARGDYSLQDQAALGGGRPGTPGTPGAVGSRPAAAAAAAAGSGGVVDEEAVEEEARARAAAAAAVAAAASPGAQPTTSDALLAALTESPLEHLLASALACHPDTLRSQNSRRAALQRDCAAFYARVALSNAQLKGAPLSAPPSLANTVVCPPILTFAAGSLPRPLADRGGLGAPAAAAATHFLRSLHWLTFAAQALLAAPLLLNTAQAALLLALAQPLSWGLTQLLLGSAAHALLWGLGQWAHSAYRPTPSTYTSLAFAAGALALWMYACVLLSTEGPANSDPASATGSASGVGTVSLAALWCVTAALSFPPLALLLHLHHEGLASALGDLGAMLLGLGLEDRLAAAGRARQAEESSAVGARGLPRSEYEREAGAAAVLEAKQSALQGGGGGVVDVAAALGLPAGREASIGAVLGTATLAAVEEAVVVRDREEAEEGAAAEAARRAARERAQAAQDRGLPIVSRAGVGAQHSSLGSSRSEGGSSAALGLSRSKLTRRQRAAAETAAAAAAAAAQGGAAAPEPVQPTTTTATSSPSSFLPSLRYPRATTPRPPHPHPRPAHSRAGGCWRVPGAHRGPGLRPAPGGSVQRPLAARAHCQPSCAPGLPRAGPHQPAGGAAGGAHLLHPARAPPGRAAGRGWPVRAAVPPPSAAPALHPPGCGRLRCCAAAAPGAGGGAGASSPASPPGHHPHAGLPGPHGLHPGARAPAQQATPLLPGPGHGLQGCPGSPCSSEPL